MPKGPEQKEREQEEIKNREEKYTDEDWSVFKASLGRFTERLGEDNKDVPPELKQFLGDPVSAKLLLDSSLPPYNYRNYFYRDKSTGEAGACQSGVQGDYGVPANVEDNPEGYDTFVFDHMTFSELKNQYEDYVLYGKTDLSAEQRKDELDIIPDWLTIECLKAGLRDVKDSVGKIDKKSLFEYLKRPDTHDRDRLAFKFGEAGKRDYPLDSEKA